ncbi:MAG: hypothetical protein ABSE73_02080 [Planctomycetota bacterium]
MTAMMERTLAAPNQMRTLEWLMAVVPVGIVVGPIQAAMEVMVVTQAAVIRVVALTGVVAGLTQAAMGVMVVTPAAVIRAAVARVDDCIGRSSHG